MDGDSRRHEHRYEVIGVADNLDVPRWFHKVECDQDVVQERLVDRTDAPSDVDFEIHKRLTIDQLERPHVVANTADAPDWGQPSAFEHEVRGGKLHEAVDPDEYHSSFDGKHYAGAD